jgi:hypothetical protein
MASNWFECAVKFERMGDEAIVQKVTEKYLIDALSFTEAEARIIEHLRPFIDGELTVSTVKRGKISEIFFNENGERWFKAKVNYITLDEEKGVERKIPCTMLVQADDIKEALNGIFEGMKGSMADYEIYSITTTEIEEVVKYEAEED